MFCLLTEMYSLDTDMRKIQVETNAEILKVIINSTRIVLDCITYAFRGRMGCFPEEVIALQEKILNQTDAYTNANKSNWKLDNSIKSSSCTISVILSIEDLTIINDCLNEICNGLKIEKFEEKIGISKNSAKNLLAEVNAMIIRS